MKNDVNPLSNLRSALIGQGSSKLTYAHICQGKSPNLPPQPPLPISEDPTPFYTGHTQPTAPPLPGGIDA